MMKIISTGCIIYVLLIVNQVSLKAQSALETPDFLTTYYRFIPSVGNFKATEIYYYEIDGQGLPPLFVINECVETVRVGDEVPDCKKVQQTGVYYKDIKSIEYDFQDYKRVGIRKQTEDESNPLIPKFRQRNEPPKESLIEVQEAWKIIIRYNDHENHNASKSAVIMINPNSGELFVQRFTNALSHFAKLAGAKLIKRDMFDK